MSTLQTKLEKKNNNGFIDHLFHFYHEQRTSQIKFIHSRFICFKFYSFWYLKPVIVNRHDLDFLYETKKSTLIRVQNIGSKEKKPEC